MLIRLTKPAQTRLGSGAGQSYTISMRGAQTQKTGIATVARAINCSSAAHGLPAARQQQE